MIDRQKNANRLGTILDGGIRVMTDMISCQKRMHECVILRDWIALQKEITVRETLEARMTEIETERRGVIESIAGDLPAPADFYRVTALFDDLSRAALNGKFRELKKLVLLSKTENEVFETYLAHAQSLLKGLIEAVMPSRRSRIYTRNGALNSGPVESLVLNRSF